MNADKWAGVVTTSGVTAATPASSYAHSPDRDWQDISSVPETEQECKDIAHQLLYSETNGDIRVCIKYHVPLVWLTSCSTMGQIVISGYG